MEPVRLAYSPVAVSQMLTVLSKEPVRVWSPVVLKLTQITSAEWPCVCPETKHPQYQILRENTLHSPSSLPSLPPLSLPFPPSPLSPLLTVSVHCSMPVSTLQSLAVVSILPVATSVLEGLKPRHTISPAWPRNVWKHLPLSVLHSCRRETRTSEAGY